MGPLRFSGRGRRSDHDVAGELGALRGEGHQIGFFANRRGSEHKLFRKSVPSSLSTEVNPSVPGPEAVVTPHARGPGARKYMAAMRPKLLLASASSSGRSVVAGRD